MKYAVLMVSGAMTYMPSFIKIGSSIQNIMGGGGEEYTDTETAWRCHKPSLYFSN
jgi:hypothetical protein